MSHDRQTIFHIAQNQSAVDWAYEQRCRSGTAKAVLVCIATRVDDSYECFLSIAQICRITEHGDAAVRRAVELLLEGRHIAAEWRAVNGRFASTSYRLPFWRDASINTGQEARS